MVELRKNFGGLGNRMFQGAYLLAQQAKGEIPDIYLQDEKYFENIKDEIKQLYGQGIQHSDYTSLHIRRGDYVNNPFYVDLTQTDYYDKAIAEFPNSKFLVFCADRQGDSDDIYDQKWVMEWLEAKYGDRFDLYQGFTEIDDLNAMAGCTQGHIMANSSFSWWASYIGGGVTIAPRAWFTDGVSRIKLLDNWIIL